MLNLLCIYCLIACVTLHIQSLDICTHTLYLSDYETDKPFQWKILRKNNFAFCPAKILVYSCVEHSSFSYLFITTHFSPLKLKIIKIIKLKIQSLPQEEQCFSITMISWSVLFKEVISLYSENHTKLINSYLWFLQGDHGHHLKITGI